MKFKLDENLGSRWVPLFQEAGYEADTVIDENLSGTSDSTIFETCIREHLCLVTLDLDFADVLRFPPARTGGVAILRPPKGNSATILEQLILNLLRGLNSEFIAGRLWVVEATRICVHQTEP